MGRPIKKKWFGPAAGAGTQIIVNGVKWADGTTSTNAYIVKQTGSRKYVVSNGTKTEPVFMVNATSVGGLQAGQCFILATPFGGSARPCEKIAQFRVSIYEANGEVNDYSWSTQPAAAPGQADLITLAELGYPINTVLPVVSGTIQVGQTISTTDGTWTGDAPITYSYVWLDDGEETGVTTSSFIPDEAWLGSMVSVRVTATNSVGSATVTSLEVGPVIGA